jgi:nucleoid-associated protein YgaU
VIVAILTILVLMAVVFTIFKILTGETNEPGISPAKTTAKASTTLVGSATAAPAATSLPAGQTAAPTVVASTTPPAAGDYTNYTVKSGDSMSSIAQQFYHDSSLYVKLAQYNGIPAPYDALSIGQILKIPTTLP